MARNYILLLWGTSFKENKSKSDKCVYIFQLRNGIVKIGVTSNFKQRKSTTENNSGFKIENYCHTELMKNKDAREIELKCHTAFKNHRQQGEFFNVDFGEACLELKKYADIVF